jgi:transcriptional regulator with XRE-family HTH domain
MYIAELGARIRQARKSRGLTQAALAKQAGVTRETLNQLETGQAKDLGIAKVFRLLRILEVDVSLMPRARTARDYVRLAAAAGSTGFRESLAEEELLRILLTGKLPPGKRPHVRRLFEDSPASLVRGLVAQVSEWSDEAKLRANVTAIAGSLDVELRPEWTQPA